MQQAPQGTIARKFTPSLGVYFELAKPRITALLVVVALFSAVIASGSDLRISTLLITLGTVLSLATGIFSLNQYMEREGDAKMMRTRERPIPSGRISPAAALIFGLAVLVLSLVFSWFVANPLTFVLSAAIAVSYLLIYTPLKYRTAFHTTLGAIPGAAPPLVGWAVATAGLSLDAWILFGILLFWQYPHFLSIEMIYRDDYERADVKVVPVRDVSGVSTALQIILAQIILLAVTLAPVFTGMGGIAYGICAGILGLAFLFFGIRAIATRKKMDARWLLKASVFYLPLVLIALILPI